MQSDPSSAHFVAPPTVFLSHAWLFLFVDVLTALRSFVDALPEGSLPPFFWFDTFSVDEHATQSLPQEWWSSTFQEAIKLIGPSSTSVGYWVISKVPARLE